MDDVDGRTWQRQFALRPFEMATPPYICRAAQSTTPPPSTKAKFEMTSETPPVKIPDLSLSQSLFTLRSQPASSPAHATAQSHLLTEIETNALAPLYLLLKDDLADWSQTVYDALIAKNNAEEEKLDAKLKEAEEMNGESEVSEALIAKFMFLTKILDKV
jgi:hypothetical protein